MANGQDDQHMPRKYTWEEDGPGPERGLSLPAWAGRMGAKWYRGFVNGVKMGAVVGVGDVT